MGLFIDSATNDPSPDLASSLETFVDTVQTQQNQIYECLKGFESELLHSPNSHRITPCDLRRLLPSHVLDIILPALPVAKFTLGSNGRNINGKLQKTAKFWDLNPIQILFAIGFDYKPQGQGFFIALLNLAAALPHQFDTAIAQLCAQARSRREGTASAIQTRSQSSNLNNKRTLSLVLGDVQAVLNSIQPLRPRPNKKSAAGNPSDSTTTTKVGLAGSLGSFDNCESQAKALSATPARNTTTEQSASTTSPATQNDSPEHSELPETGRGSDSSQSVDFDPFTASKPLPTTGKEIGRRRESSGLDDFDPFAASELSPKTGSRLFVNFGSPTTDEVPFENIYNPEPDNTPVYDARDDPSYNSEESHLDSNRTKFPASEPDPADNLGPPEELSFHIKAASQDLSLPKPGPTQPLKQEQKPVMAGSIGGIAMPRGIKRTRQEYDPEHVRTLVRPETPVQAEWLDQACQDIFGVMAPSMSYVGPSDFHALVKPDARPSLRIAEYIWNSTLTVLMIHLEPDQWAVAAVHHRQELAHSVNLFNPMPSSASFTKASQLINGFINNLLPKTPPERRIVRKASTPLQDNTADSGVVAFACAMCLVSATPLPLKIHTGIWRRVMASFLGVKVDD
ncbi:hypothetical protein K4K52_012676 [Colletotrichum sp. SAR 10_76]|nr:hypothetical protein K4K52_012676 [Colletotrichum sp. SAR 10_76]